MTHGLESEIKSLDELTVEKLVFHPAIVQELQRRRLSYLNLLRTTHPTDAPNIARAQAGLDVIDLLLGNRQSGQPSLAEHLVKKQQTRKAEPTSDSETQAATRRLITSNRNR